MQHARLGFIGIAFPHLIRGIKEGINLCGVPVEAVLFSARGGSQIYVKDCFPGTPFFDQDRLMHADWPYLEKKLERLCPKIDRERSKEINVHELDEVELHHCAYTMCRRAVFREAQDYVSKEAMFQKGLDLCLKLIQALKVDALVYTTTPHNVFDVLLHMAARRLNKATYVFAWLEFGDYVYPRYFTRNSMEDDNLKAIERGPSAVGNSAGGPESKFKNQLIEYLDSRNRSSEKFNVWYMDPKAEPAPPIGAPRSPIFTTTAFYRLFRMFGGYSDRSAFMLDDLYVRYMRYMEMLFLRILNKAAQPYRWLMCRKALNDLSMQTEHAQDILLFALHYHPEQTSSTSAFCSPFEAESLRKLSMAFPNKTIIAKEHPAMLRGSKALNFRRYRGRRFFDEIGDLENVIYVPQIEPAAFTALLRRTECVFSFTGTVSIEAILLRCPCILFGHNAYSAVRGCRMATDVSEVDQKMINDLREELKDTVMSDLLDDCLSVFEKMPIERCFIGGKPSTAWDSEALEKAASRAFMPIFVESVANATPGEETL